MRLAERQPICSKIQRVAHSDREKSDTNLGQFKIRKGNEVIGRFESELVPLAQIVHPTETKPGVVPEVVSLPPGLKNQIEQQPAADKQKRSRDKQIYQCRLFHSTTKIIRSRLDFLVGLIYILIVRFNQLIKSNELNMSLNQTRRRHGI